MSRKKSRLGVIWAAIKKYEKTHKTIQLVFLKWPVKYLHHYVTHIQLILIMKIIHEMLTKEIKIAKSIFKFHKYLFHIYATPLSDQLLSKTWWQICKS